MNTALRLVIGMALLLAGCGGQGVVQATQIDGLSQPRGLSLRGSSLCVAEAGAIGSDGPSRERPGQLEAQTGRVLCSTDGSEPTVLVGELPFVYYPEAAVTSGAADVIQDGDKAWVLVGESYGRFARSIIGVTSTHAEEVVDLEAFAEARSAADGGQLRSNPWSMVPDVGGSGFLISDAASGQILQADVDGMVTVFAPVPGHEVLTGLAWGPDDLLYVASFGQLPHPEASGAVVAVEPDGASRTVIEGLTMVIDIGFDPDGNMFILEYSRPPDEPEGVDAYRDGTGRLLFLPASTPDAAPTVLLDALDRPTALVIGDDAIWISLSVGEQARGEGSVVRFGLAELGVPVA